MLAVILRADGTYHLREDIDSINGVVTVEEGDYRVVNLSRCPQWKAFGKGTGGLPTIQELNELSMEEAVYTVGVWADDVAWPIDGRSLEERAQSIKIDIRRLYADRYNVARESSIKKQVLVDQLHLFGLVALVGIVVLLIAATLFGGLVGWWG